MSSSAKSMPASSRAMSSTSDCLMGCTRRLSAPPSGLRLAGLSQCLGFDQVAHRFGLGEIELAGEEGALREFSRLGEARAEVESAAQKEVEYDGRSVGRDFNEIV